MKKAHLDYLAKYGDIEAQAIVELAQSGIERIVVLDNVAAKAANDVVTAKAGNLADNVLAIEAGAAAKLAAHPRNVRCTFAAAWDGGDITITGTDQFGRPQTEVIADNPGNTVVGAKVWKTITKVAKQAVGAAADAVQVGTGDKLACGTVKLANPFASLLTDSTSEAVTMDVTNSAFTPNTVPDGAHDYQILVRAIAA